LEQLTIFGGFLCGLSGYIRQHFWLMMISGDVLIFLGNSFSGFPGTFLNHLEPGSGSFATGPNVSK